MNSDPTYCTSILRNWIAVKWLQLGGRARFFFLTLSLFLLPSFIHRQSSIKHQLEYDCLHYDSFYLNENKSSRLIVVVSCLLGRFTSQRRRAHFIETHLNRMFGLFPLLFFSTRSSVFFYRSNSTKKKNLNIFVWTFIATAVLVCWINCVSRSTHGTSVFNFSIELWMAAIITHSFDAH